MMALICLLTGFAMWLLAYILIVMRGFRRATYGMILMPICYNVSWDFTFTLRDSDLLGGMSDPVINPLTLNVVVRLFAAIWALGDIMMLYQVVRNRTGTKLDSWRNRHIYFYIAILVTSGIGCINLTAGMFRTPAVHCLTWGFGSGVVIALSYVVMALSRTNFRGQSLSAALLRLVGMQLTCIIMIRVMPTSIMLIVMLTCLFADLAYILLLDRWCRERRVSIWTLL